MNKLVYKRHYQKTSRTREPKDAKEMTITVKQRVLGFSMPSILIHWFLCQFFKIEV
jgi:hypothetical protein